MRDTENTLLYNQTDFIWDGELGGIQHSVVFGVSFLEEDFHLDTGNVFRTATARRWPCRP